jgi:hypothetical protein
MPLDVTFKIEGLAKLQRELKQAGEDTQDLKTAGRNAAKIVMTEAKRTAPVRTGALKRSIRTSVTKKNVGILGGKALVVPYAQPIHWGWPKRGIRENPWISRAARLTQPQWLPGYIKEIDKATAKVKGAPRGQSS